MGAYSRRVLIRVWALIQGNAILEYFCKDTISSKKPIVVQEQRKTASIFWLNKGYHGYYPLRGNHMIFLSFGRGTLGYVVYNINMNIY